MWSNLSTQNKWKVTKKQLLLNFKSSVASYLQKVYLGWSSCFQETAHQTLCKDHLFQRDGIPSPRTNTNTSWFNYFARGVFHHNLASIKVLKCELESTKSFNKSYLICHVQIIPISLEHLQRKHTRTSPTMEACFAVLCYLSQFQNLNSTIYCKSQIATIPKFPKFINIYTEI